MKLLVVESSRMGKSKSTLTWMAKKGLFMLFALRTQYNRRLHICTVSMNVDLGNVVGFTCPACGRESHSRNTTESTLLLTTLLTTLVVRVQAQSPTSAQL